MTNEWLAYILSSIVVMILVVLIVKNRDELWTFKIKHWGPVAPLILSIAAFFLAAQQAIFSRMNFEKVEDEDRPRLSLTPPLKVECDVNTGLGNVEFHLTNFGKAPGHLSQHRTLFELSNFTPLAHGRDQVVRYLSNLDSLRIGSANYDFQTGPLEFVPVMSLSKEACKSLLSGKLIRLTLEVDYTSLRRLAPKKFTYRYRASASVNKNNEGITHNVQQQLDIETPKLNDLTETLKSMISDPVEIQMVMPK